MGDPPPRRAPARAPVRAPRRLRPLRLVPRLRAARPLQHREPPPHRADPREAFDASSIDYATRVSESVLVRLHYIVYIAPGRAARVRRRAIEARIVAATRSWADDLEDGAGRRARRGARQRPATRATARPSPRRTAPTGWRAQRWPTSSGSRSWPARRPGDEPLPPARGAGRRHARQDLPRRARRWRCRTCCRCSRTWASRSTTSALTRCRRRPAAGVDLRFRARLRRRRGSSTTDGRASMFQDAFIRTWHGDAENDGYNRLVLRASLTWREVSGAARGGQVPAPGGHDVQRPLHRGGARRRTRRSPRCSSTLFRARFDPDARASDDGATARHGRARSRRRSTRSRASTRTASCAASWR